MLHDFIVENRPEIIQRCRAKVATRSMPPPTAAELDHGVPMFLDDLNDALRVPDIINRGIGRTTLQRRHDLVSYGFSVSQVVLDFSDLCQVIIELAVEMNHPISTENFEM